MRSLFQKTIFSMAIAIFSMFFGAGNAIFPLVLGMQAGTQYGWAFLGLLVTGIGGPLLGLLGGTLYRGHCTYFFGRAGKIAGPILIGLTLAMLGPFAVLPRCVTVAHAAISPLMNGLGLTIFAPIFCFIALLLCFKRKFLLPVLGYVLSPILISCLFLIISQSFFMPSPIESMHVISAASAMGHGICTGYETMDLIASIYFSAGIWTMIEIHSDNKSPKHVFSTTLKAGLLGCFFLALIYLGLTHAAAVYAPYLVTTPQEQLMTKLANTALGPTLGIVANIAIALACLTTVISLVMTIAQIISCQISHGKISYKGALILQLVITSMIAPIGFSGIMMLIHYPITIAYPVIIVLTIINIIFKLRRRDLLPS